MRQTILTVILEVQPASTERLAELIRDLRARLESTSSGVEEYAVLRDRVPALHFLSMSIFRDVRYDPVLTLEANFDGPAGPFWAQFEAALGDELREMVRCCKPPTDDTRGLYDAVTKRESTRALAPFFEAKTVRPAVSHMGNRGRSRDQIIAEGKLFEATRSELRQRDPKIPNPYRPLSAAGIHQRLRAALLPTHPWLTEPAPVRIDLAEGAADWIRFGAFLFLVLLCLSLPGLVLAPTGTSGRVFLVLLIATPAVAFQLYRLRTPLIGQDAPKLARAILTRRRVVFQPVRTVAIMAFVLVVLVGYTYLAALVVAPAVSLLGGHGFGEAYGFALKATWLGLLSVPLSVGIILLWVRWLEYRDPSHDAPPVNERRMRAMARREDRLPQNHMGSMVLVKPGLLRAVLIRVGLWGLGLFLRILPASRNGYLANMRTIHFAHWALVSNGGRLLFFSNYDGTWESYLDDFIEKANEGLTLAWTNGVGFPPTRFLVQDGASHGRRFKAWARHSMAVTLLWYSAYKHYTVNQIERHARIANGLRRPTLTPKEADEWARDL